MPPRPFLSYSPKTTSINFPWPAEVTGLERIALSAQGGLQRVLSAFFARPISIALVYSSTFIQGQDQPTLPVILPNPPVVGSASPTTPIIQTRKVHLQCSGKNVCTAISTVRITSPFCAHLFLEEKYAIGQMFTRLEKVPVFELNEVGFGHVSEGEDGAASPPEQSTDNYPSSLTSKQLWRKYKLSVKDFECDILEIFPDRDMFTMGEKWLTMSADEKEDYSSSYSAPTHVSSKLSGPFNSNTFLLCFSVLFVLELLRLFAARSHSAC